MAEETMSGAIEQHSPTDSNFINFTIPSTGESSKTFYKIVGKLSSAAPPLVVLHGGPGIPHSYLTAFSELAANNIPVIFYDQIGCGESSHFPSRLGDAEFWSYDLFVAELENLLSHLGIQTFDLLGHSWGATLASEFILRRQPKGLRRLVLWSPLASQKVARAESRRLIYEDGSEELIREFEKAEREGRFESKEYNDAVTLLFSKHLCRVQPWPEELLSAVGAAMKDTTVSKTLLGPSALTTELGALKDWDITAQLNQITTTTLVLNGEFDAESEACVRPFVENMPNANRVMFKGCSHLAWIEDKETSIRTLLEFLQQND